MENRKPYPSDVSDEEWAFVAPYLTCSPGRRAAQTLTARGVQRRALVWCAVVAHGGMLPNDLPPWSLVYQQMQRWLESQFALKKMVHDLRVLLRLADGRPIRRPPYR